MKCLKRVISRKNSSASLQQSWSQAAFPSPENVVFPSISILDESEPAFHRRKLLNTIPKSQEEFWGENFQVIQPASARSQAIAVWQETGRRAGREPCLPGSGEASKAHPSPFQCGGSAEPAQPSGKLFPALLPRECTSQHPEEFPGTTSKSTEI